MSQEDLHERLAPLRTRRFDDPDHKDALRAALRTASEPRRPGRKPWFIGWALFGAGATAAFAAQAGYRHLRLTLESDDRPMEVVLTPLQPTTDVPVGTLRAEDGSRYVIEEREGGLVLRPVEAETRGDDE